MLAALAAIAFAPQRMLVVDNLLIAVYDGKKWARPAEPAGVAPIFTGDFIKLNLDGSAAAKPFPAALVLERETPPGYWLDMGRHIPGVFYSGPKWKAAKTTPIRSQAYKDILLRYVRKQVPGAKLATFKGLQVDLNGDGRVETLLAGGSRSQDELRGATAGGAKKTDFSIVLLRAVVNGTVKEVVVSFTKIEGKAENPDDNYLPNVSDLLTVANLDNDRHIEIISTLDFYEGQSANIKRWDGKRLIEIVENGSGV